MTSRKGVTNGSIARAVARRKRITRVIVAVAAAGLLTSACDVHGTTTPGALSTLRVSPDPQTLAANGTQQFAAVGADFSGAEVPVTPTWSVVAGGGTISSSGLFTAGSVPGTFASTVQATSGRLSSAATVVVTVGPLATLVITPSPATLTIGAAQQFVAVGQDASGNVVAVTPTWTVVAGGGAIGLTTGLFTAGNTSGVYPNTVRANVGALVAVATVTVENGQLAAIAVTPNPTTLQAGSAQRFTAVGTDAGGNIVAITPTWAIVQGGGSIDANTGDFRAGTAAGTFAGTVRASSGSVSGSATVTVTAIPPGLATIVVTPDPVSMQAGRTQQLSATGRDGNGDAFPISVRWSVVSGGGSIDANSGLFTAGSASGTFVNTVRATSGTISGSATVTIAPIAPSLLGAAAPNGIMAGTAVTCVNLGTINADVSISPGNTLTGFGPCVITGVQHLGDATAAQAQLALTAAYDSLAGLACPPANAIVANLGGTTKAAGVYCTASGIGVTGTLTLDGGGDPNAVFVFQAGSGLTTAGDVILINGAQAGNVYWVVGTSATIGTASQWKGNILAYTSITLVDNAKLIGRALARNGAVSLGTSNTITLP